MRYIWAAAVTLPDTEADPAGKGLPIVAPIQGVLQKLKKTSRDGTAQPTRDSMIKITAKPSTTHTPIG